MISLPEGFNLALFISDIVTYVGIPIVSISFSFCIFRLITYSMHMGSKK